MTTMDLPSTCESSDLGLRIAIGLAGLVLAFVGYRIYKAYIIVMGFVLFFAIDWAAGKSWYEQSPGVDQKAVVVVVCAVGWGIIGALLTMKFVDRIQRCIGFLLGALLGVCLTAAIVDGLKDEVNAQLSTGYKGWESFALVTFAFPVALAVGYLLRNFIKYGLMLASALGGACLASDAAAKILSCKEVDYFQRKVNLYVLVLVLAVLGLVTQIATDPEENHFRKRLSEPSSARTVVVAAV